MLAHSIKRLRREGAKSLSVPLIALVLVVLINLLGGIRVWLEDLYDDTMENFPIVAVVSNLFGDNTDDLQIDLRYINMFIDPDVSLSLAEHTGEISLRRTLEIFSILGHISEISLTGITGINSDEFLSSEYGVEIKFFEGYDEGIFLSEELVGIVSEDLFSLVREGILVIMSEEKLPDEVIEEPVFPELEEGQSIWIDYMNGQPFYSIYYRVHGVGVLEPFFPEYVTTVVEGKTVIVEKELTVIGTVTGAVYNTVYIPFWALSRVAEEIDDSFVYSELLNVTLKNNSEMSGFKELAGLTFSRTTPLGSTRPFAITVYDSEFYETLEPLRQNIIVVDIATPFIYILSIAIGFLTSVLLTRRRKAEFAIMRSIGVSKWVVFISALTEQATLSFAGAAAGFAFVALVWDYASLTRPAIFLACYLIGAVFAAFGAAGTNVMKVLRDRGE
jgi:hypothetical protein